MGADASISYAGEYQDFDFMDAWFNSDTDFAGVNHIEFATRYWSPSYQRGPWPLYEMMLTYLLNHPKVESVEYGSRDDGLGVMPISMAQVRQYSEVYHGLYQEKWHNALEHRLEN